MKTINIKPNQYKELLNILTFNEHSCVKMITKCNCVIKDGEKDCRSCWDRFLQPPKNEIGDDKDREVFTIIPPTRQEFLKYAYDYAQGFYDFPICKIKVGSLLTNSYEHWEENNWKRDGKPISSIRKTIQTAVRSKNTKLKDWTV